MTGFDHHWQSLTNANPQLKIDGTKVTLSVDELQRLLRKFYNAGEIGGELGDLLSKFRDLSQR